MGDTRWINITLGLKARLRISILLQDVSVDLIHNTCLFKCHGIVGVVPPTPYYLATYPVGQVSVPYTWIIQKGFECTLT